MTVLIVLCVGAGTAAAASPRMQLYPTQPDALVGSIVTGPDGALWTTCFQCGGLGSDTIGRMGTDGTWTGFPAPAGWHHPEFGRLTAGGGALWVEAIHDGNDYIDEWTMLGTMTAEFQVPGAGLGGLLFGPDGDIWFGGAATNDLGLVDGSYIGRMTTTGQLTTYAMPDSKGLASTLTIGPDGAIWFGEGPGGNIGRITMSGQIQEWPIAGDPTGLALQANPYSIAAGDGSLWYADPFVGLIRITTSGTVSSVPLPWGDVTLVPHDVTVAADGTVWVTSGENNVFGQRVVGRLNAGSGDVAGYLVDGPLAIGALGSITAGPDGRIWFGGQGFIGALDPNAPPDAAPVSSGGGVSVPSTGAESAPWIGAALVVVGVTLLCVSRRSRRGRGGYSTRY